MSKIDFMAGLPVPAEPDALGLDVGQSWRTKSGEIVAIIGKRADGNFNVQRGVGFAACYMAKPNGVSLGYRFDGHDLVERVQRVYIAGPMTGYVDLNFPAFNAAAAEYRRRGCFVINPAEICGGADELDAVAQMTGEQKENHWRKCMVKDINALLTCEMIVMLDGWTQSKGANLEHHVARSLGLTIAYPVDTYKAEVPA